MNKQAIIDLSLAYLIHEYDGDTEGMRICMEGIVEEVCSLPIMQRITKTKKKKIKFCPKCNDKFPTWECPTLNLRTKRVTTRCCECGETWDVPI